MGLDGAVACNCWRDGRSAPPPVPREWIILDEDGFIHLALQGRAHERAFDVWKATGCDHAEMELFGEKIGSQGAVNELRAELARKPAEYPALLAAIPDGTEGRAPATLAASALAELERFRGDTHTLHELIDEESGTPARVASVAWVGATDDGGVDADGFFITRVQPDGARGEVFRARRFEQCARFEDGQWTASDLINEEADRCVRSANVKVVRTQPPPRWLRVETAVRSDESFALLLDTLRLLFDASLDAGNPVRFY